MFLFTFVWIQNDSLMSFQIGSMTLFENEAIYVVWAYIFGNLYQFKWICVDSVAEGESYGIDFASLESQMVFRIDVRHMFAIV